MLKMFRKGNQKGFTLIELLIVVAIIGILAAIAIPQFASYRMRAFNSSAQSDVRNVNTSEAAFYADWQSFADSVATAIANPPVYAGSVGGAGAVLTGPTGTVNNTGVFPSITATLNAVNRGVKISLGKDVTLLANTVANANGVLSTFCAVSKHLNGDTYFGVDVDSSAVYYDQFEGKADGTTAVVAGTIPSITVDKDDFVGVAGPSTNNWVAK